MPEFGATPLGAPPGVDLEMLEAPGVVPPKEAVE
jgi:hypothetical protein